MPKLPSVLKKAALAIGGLAFFELGARIGLPGVNLSALSRFMNQGPRNGLLGLYDLLGGGALGRGAVLALGVFPYVSARIMMRVVRAILPRVQRLSETHDGHDRLKRWTRALTLGLAALQGYGFSQFLQNTPGAVENPGLGFTAQTMLILMAGSAIAMMLTEMLLAPREEDDDLPLDRSLSAGQVPVVPVRTAASVARKVPSTE